MAGDLLLDTGAWVALIDRSEAAHKACVEVVARPQALPVPTVEGGLGMDKRTERVKGYFDRLAEGYDANLPWDELHGTHLR